MPTDVAVAVIGGMVAFVTTLLTAGFGYLATLRLRVSERQRDEAERNRAEAERVSAERQRIIEYWQALVEGHQEEITRLRGIILHRDGGS